VPPLSVTDTLPDVLKKLTWSCLQHFQGNLHGAMASDDGEYLHQMRVALRRLRVVLRMAEKVCADRTLAALYKDVSDLCVALGKLREWDVFISQTVKPMRARMSRHAGLQTLLASSERQRAACYAALRSDAQARDLQRLLLRFAIWMNGPYWKKAGWNQAGPEQSAQAFATRRLQKQDIRFTRAGRNLDAANAAQLHALRILAKKLRYSAEFFADLYDKGKAGPFLGALSKVQDVLGQINDIAVAHRLLDELATDAALAAHREAVVLARGWIAHDLSGQLATLRKFILVFKKQPKFWKNN
jgi:triphosphatase